MPRAYYNDAKEVAERLRQQGDRAWADRLTSAIEEGFTATEILMALRHHLDDLLTDGPTLEEHTRNLASSLKSDIDAALS
jgi:hypothetical protein